MKSLLFILSAVVLTRAHSPVVMWPASEFPLKDGQSALESMSPDNFERMVAGKNVVIFHKKAFSLEDLTVSRGSMSYLATQDLSALQGVSKIHHLLKKLTHSNNLKFVELPGSDLAVNQDQIKKTMEESPGYAAILVSSGTHKMSKRAVGDEPAIAAPPATLCAERENGCAMVYIKSAKSGSEDFLTCIVTCASEGSPTMIRIAGTDKAVDIEVVSSNGGYVLKFVNSTTDIDEPYAPNTFSYSCGIFTVTTKVDNKTKFTTEINTFQVFLTTAANSSFPDSFDCTTWFTPSLWMGFIVVLFYLLILFMAMLFLYDIKTNDRFDDPKGKTITVNVSE